MAFAPGVGNSGLGALNMLFRVTLVPDKKGTLSLFDRCSHDLSCIDILGGWFLDFIKI